MPSVGRTSISAGGGPARGKKGPHTAAMSSDTLLRVTNVSVSTRRAPHCSRAPPPEAMHALSASSEARTSAVIGPERCMPPPSVACAHIINYLRRLGEEG
eukprot:1192367-Prorocentrum_minimum.AAC.2